MALFKRKTAEDKEKKEPAVNEEVKETAEVKTSPAVAPTQRDHTHTLRAPRITEKATFAMEKGAYVFNIDPRATKNDVKAAMQALYKVTPKKIGIVNVRPKKIQSRQRGIFGQASRGKKAYVYLREGDTIEII